MCVVRKDQQYASALHISLSLQYVSKLLSYPGQIFTRIQLMDEIWGTDSETGWETVTVHVGRLRKRFEGWNEFEIVAVRGLGYKAVKKV